MISYFEVAFFSILNSLCFLFWLWFNLFLMPCVVWFYKVTPAIHHQKIVLFFSFSSCAKHVLLVLWWWLVRWEISCCTATIFSATTLSIYIHIYIYIVIHRQTVSLYHNSTVWLDTQDSSSWDQNLPNFTLDLVSDCSDVLATYISSGIITHFELAFVFFYLLPYWIPEGSIHKKSFALRKWQPLIPLPECSTPGSRAYVLSSTERLFCYISTLLCG